MSNEHSSLTFILKLDANLSLLQYVPSNNTGEKITTKLSILYGGEVVPSGICAPPIRATLGEPTFLMFLCKTHQTVSVQNTNLARLELEEPPA